jgi:hypothetical protein
MPQSARCWHLTMSKWLKDGGFHTVGYEKSMRCIQKDGHKIMMGSHIDDFIICSTSREMLNDITYALRALGPYTCDSALGSPSCLGSGNAREAPVTVTRGKR